MKRASNKYLTCPNSTLHPRRSLPPILLTSLSLPSPLRRFTSRTPLPCRCYGHRRCLLCLVELPPGAPSSCRVHPSYPTFASTSGHTPLVASTAPSLAGPIHLLTRDALLSSPTPSLPLLPSCSPFPPQSHCGSAEPRPRRTQVLAGDRSGRGMSRSSCHEPRSVGTGSLPGYSARHPGPRLPGATMAAAS